MDLVTKRTTIRTSLDSLADRLSEALTQAGFVVCGMTDFQKMHYDRLKVHHGKHKVLWVDYPAISCDMVSQYPDEGTILPCCVSLVESFPGDIDVIVTNPTEIMATISGNTRLVNSSKRVTDLIESVVKTFETDSAVTPDLVTSWG